MIPLIYKLENKQIENPKSKIRILLKIFSKKKKTNLNNLSVTFLALKDKVRADG